MNPESFPLNRRILIVDDTPAIHADFRKLLGATTATANDLAAAAAAFLGTAASPADTPEVFELTSAYQGEEALQLVQDSLSQSRPFALAFMDVRMPPGWDGIETTARLGQIDPELQVVLCTAYSDYSWEEIVARLGDSDRLLILKKPFDRMEVLQLAKTLCEKWRLARQWNRRLEGLDRLVEQRTEELHSVNQDLQNEIGERERTATRLAAFAALGQRLNAARTVKAAGQLIVEVADQLLGWDCCLLDLYSPAQDSLVGVLNLDLVNGQRTEIESRYDHLPPPPLLRRVLQHGGQLVLREPPFELPAEGRPFGDTSRPSASLLFVPIHDGRSVIGVLSIQSYTLQAYTEQSLATLQALADHCGGALERIRTEEALRQRQRMENLISSLSTTFINLGPGDTDAAVTNALKIIGTFLRADFSCIESLTRQGDKLQQTHLWYASDLPAPCPPNGPSWEALPWWMEKLRRLNTIALPKLAALPPEASREREFLQARNIQSLLAVPLVRGGTLLGFLGLGTVRRALPWPAEVIALLKMLGEIIVNALEHKRAAERVAAFSCLGQRLSAAQTAKEAAQIIAEVADQLLGWDACTCDLYAPEEGLLVSLLVMDIIDGQRSECAPRHQLSSPSPTAKRALEKGGQLLLRERSEEVPTEQLSFGNTARRSASLLFVPIRNGAKVIGLLSIQSYTPHAYDRHSLETLQALADHCGGALERIHAQEAHDKSKERLNAFFTGATAGLALMDKELRYLQLNDILAEINGLPAGQHLGRTLREVLPKLAPTIEPILRQVFATGQPALNIELTGETPSQPGVQRHWVVSYFPIKGRDGVPEALGGMVTDITDHKRLEAELRQAQKMEAIGQLAGGVAHDFNNLLAVIRGNAELVALSPDHLQAEQQEFLAQIVGAADRAANLTRQLLAFSRKQLMQPQALNLNEVLGNLTKMLKRIIGEDLDLQCSYAAHSPRVLADIGMLEQVLLNLVVNARDAMPQGGHVLLHTETVEFDGTPDPTHPQARAGTFACLSVRDTGSGIAPEHLSRIFDPFFTTKEPGKGTGLGLATVYGIVHQHQGWVEVSSQVGVGSTFKIFLPALKTAVPESGKARPEPAPRGGTETILLVEDDEAVRSLTHRLLGNSGYQVRTAASGRQALELWAHQGQEIDLLLTDMIMPEGLSGQELAQQLLAQRPDLKVLFMSGYSGDAISKDTSFLQRTNSRFLQKPCSARTLLQAVRQALDAT